MPSSSSPNVDEAADEQLGDLTASIQRGAELLEARQLEAARVCLERAYNLEPSNPRAQNLLGLVYFKLGLLEAARSIYDRLVTGYPSEASLWVNLGLVLLRQGRLSEANSALREAIDLSPGHRRAHAYLGLVLYRRGDLQMAYDHFVKGGADEFADKVRERLSSVGRSMPTQAELLRAVATDGVEGIESDTASFQGVDTVKDGRVVRDEEAWEAHVTHALERGGNVWQRQPSEGEPRTEGSNPSLSAGAPPFDAFATGDTNPPPSNDPFARTPEDHTPRFLPAVEAPWQGDDRNTPAPAAWPTRQTGFDLTASGISSVGPADGLEAPSLVSSAPPSMPQVVVDASLPATDQLPPVTRGLPSVMGGDSASAPPLPSVSGGRSTAGTTPPANVPSAVAGFVAGPGPRARLGLSGTAHLRASVLVAASGRLEMREAFSTSGDDPICVLSGNAVLHLRVPRCAVALREARDLFVMKSACVGFDDGFDWDHGISHGLEVLSLHGKGSLLLDTRGPSMLLPVSHGHPVHAASDALLAWSREVDPSALSRGDRSRLFQFRGKGYVLVAFPPDAHSDLGDSEP